MPQKISDFIPPDADLLGRPSEAQLRIITGVVAGLTNREIGLKFFLSEDTVKTHLRQLMRKYNLRNRCDLAAEAIRRGWVEPVERTIKWQPTARQQEIIDLAARGQTNDAIADALGLSRYTVKCHLERIYAKVGPGPRTKLIPYASQK